MRLMDKREIENQSRLFYKNPYSKKGNVRVRTHLPIITQEMASNLGYVAAIPIADLILYNIQKELIGACTSEDSISSRVLEVEASWMAGALDVQYELNMRMKFGMIEISSNGKGICRGRAMAQTQQRMVFRKWRHVRGV